MPYDSSTGIYTYDGTEAASPYKTMLNLLGNSVKTAIANLAASFSDTQQGAAQWAYNSCFDIWQRGTGDFTATGWTADRWNMISRTATTVRRTTLAASDTFFQTAYAMQIQATNATNSAKIVQPFPSEDVAEMRGKTVVFEVYAQALTSATTQLTVAIEKSTTANVATSGTWSVVNSTTSNVTQAGTKVLVTTTIPADSTAAGVRISVSTNNVPNSGGVNIGRITFKPGTTGPTQHQRRGRTIEGELASCQVFLYAGVPSAAGRATSVTVAETFFSFPVTMRATPTISHVANYSLIRPGIAFFTVTNTVLSAAQPNGGLMQHTTSGLTADTLVGTVITGGCLYFSAELP